jgi:hypothetical protein
MTILGFLAFAVPFGVYVASLWPGVDLWDTAELQTVPYILGIPHPTGFPVYVLAGWVWSHVVLVGDVAYRMNLFSAFSISLAALALFGAVVTLEAEPLFAFGAALVFAFATTTWTHAIRAEVHTFALALVGLGFWAALRWWRAGDGRMLVAAALAGGLAVGAHSGMVLVVPGIGLVALARRPGVRRASVALACAAAVAVAAYAYLPIRSAIVTAERRDPTLALGIAPGRPFWDNDHPSSPAGFHQEVSGGEFGATGALAKLLDTHVLAAVPSEYINEAEEDLSLGVLVLALIGVVILARRTPLVAAGVFLAGALPVLFVLAYTVESDVKRYFLPSYWAIAFFLALGVDLLARGGMGRAPRAVIALITGFFLYVAGADVYGGRDRLVYSHGTAQPVIDRVIQATPNNAILVSPWLYATALAYGAYVEHDLGDRIVVTGWSGDYLQLYPVWLRTRPIVFVTDEAVSIPGYTITNIEPEQIRPQIFRLEKVR